VSSTQVFEPESFPVDSVTPQVQVEKLGCRPAGISLDRRLPGILVARFLVALYKLISIAVLSFILLGLGSYLFLTIFYFLSQSWMEPRIISPTDEHVLQLNNQLAQGTLLREQLATERLELLVKIRDAQREASTSNRFQHEVKRTAEQVVSDNLHQLATVQEVDGSYQSEAPRILDSDKSFSSVALAQADKLYNSHLISEEEWISRKAQLAQLGVSALSLQRNSAELDAEKNLLRREIDSYSRLLDANSEGENGLSYNVLQAKKELENSLLEQARARELAGVLSQEVAMIERAIARQDRLLLSIHNFPYLRAAEEKMTVAFVPYSNAARARVGAAVYACSLGILWCRQVGEVAEVLDGEVVDKHPFYSKEMRGFLVRIQLHDPKWDRNQVLFLDKPPLLL
jgi:hypothetical protein